MKGKFVVTHVLPDGREVGIRVTLDVSMIDRDASVLGIGDQERMNLEGSKFQEIVDIAGLAEGNGV